MLLACRAIQPLVPLQPARCTAALPHQYIAQGTCAPPLLLSDPGAPGLQVTSTGKPKVVDVVEATGSGDVGCGVVVRTASPAEAEDGSEGGAEGESEEKAPTVLRGVTGRPLTLNPAWDNPTGTWFLGAKKGYDIMPAGLVKRLKESRNQATDVHVSALLRSARAKWLQWKATHCSSRQSLSGMAGSSVDTANFKSLDELPEALKREGLEIKARIEALEQIAKWYKDEGGDPGPVFDVIAWRQSDGHWVAVVDTSEAGDLAGVEPMLPYKFMRQWRRLSDEAQLNYAVNIYLDGATSVAEPEDVSILDAMEHLNSVTVSIITDAGSHGTHVAGISAGYFPDDTSGTLNGVAPGAQIVSIKIGDTRLGSMETAAGLMRGVRAVLDTGAHVVNMSYGESYSHAQQGRFIEAIEEAVRGRGVVFVTSAGNSGPAITTVGAPAGCTSCVISVAAAATRALAKSAYSLNVTRRGAYARGHKSTAADVTEEDEGAEDFMEPPESIHYTWSSRGPSTDGDRGVTVTAPGGAVTSVPNWTLKKQQLMNGTSMSSPHTAGCVALLLSAAKLAGIPTNPYSLRKALQHSARIVPHATVWCAGGGMVHVPAAWDVLRQLSSRVATHVLTWGASESAYTMDYGISSEDDVVDPEVLEEERAEVLTAARAVVMNAEAGQPVAEEGDHDPSAGEHEVPTVGGGKPLDTGISGDARLGWFDPELQVTVPYQGSGAGTKADRGIYWRDPAQSEVSTDVDIDVTPLWRDERRDVMTKGFDGGAGTQARPNLFLQRFKVHYHRTVVLRSTAPGWVIVPDHIVLLNRGRSFKAHIDATKLPRGGAYYAEIRAYDATDVGDGGAQGVDPLQPPLFTVPITVVRGAIPQRNPDGGVNYPFGAPPVMDTSMVSAWPKGADSAFDPVSHAAESGGVPARKAWTIGGHGACSWHESNGTVMGGTDAELDARPVGTLDDDDDGSSGVPHPAMLHYTPGHIERRFIAVPAGATWADIVVRRLDDGSDVEAAAPASPDSGAGDVTLARHRGPSDYSSPGPGASFGRSRTPEANPGAASGTPSASRSLQKKGVDIAPDAEEVGAAHPAPGTRKVAGRHVAAARGAIVHAGGVAAASLRDSSPRLYAIHAVQVESGTSLKHTQKQQYTRLRPAEANTVSVRVSPGLSLEVAVAQFWASLGTSNITVEVHFRGVQVEGVAAIGSITTNSDKYGADFAPGGAGSSLQLVSGSHPTTVPLTPLLHDVTIKPEVSLTHWTQSFNPKATSIAPLMLPDAHEAVIAHAGGNRADTHSHSRLYQLRVQFEYSMPSAVKPEVKKDVYMSMASAHGADLLYESAFDEYLLTVHDISTVAGRLRLPRTGEPLMSVSGYFGGVGEVVGTSDVFPERLTNLRGGRKYLVEVRVSHPSHTLLAALADAAQLNVTMQLNKPIQVAAFSDKVAAALAGAHGDVGATGSDASTGSSGVWKTRKVKVGIRTTVVLAPPSRSQLPKSARAGDVLHGKALFADYSGAAAALARGTSASSRHPTGYGVRLTVTTKQGTQKRAKEGAEEPHQGALAGRFAVAAPGVPDSVTAIKEVTKLEDEEAGAAAKTEEEKADETQRDAALTLIKGSMAVLEKLAWSPKPEDRWHAMYELLASQLDAVQPAAAGSGSEKRAGKPGGRRGSIAITPLKPATDVLEERLQLLKVRYHAMDDFYWAQRVQAVMKHIHSAAEVGTEQKQSSEEPDPTKEDEEKGEAQLDGADLAADAAAPLDEETDALVDQAGTELLETLDVETLRRHFAVMPANSTAAKGGALDDTTANLVAVTTDDDLDEVKRKHAVACKDKKLVVETLWRLARRRVAAVWRLAGEGVLLARGGKVPPDGAIPLPWVEEPDWMEVQGRLSSWVDPSSAKYRLLELETHCRARSYARALQVTMTLLKDARGSTKGLLAGESADANGTDDVPLSAPILLSVQAALLARLRWVDSGEAQGVAEDSGSDAASAADEPSAEDEAKEDAPALTPGNVLQELIARLARPRIAAAVAVDKRAV